MAEIKDWKLQINVASVQLFEPGSMLDKLPSGVYQAKVVESVQIPNKDASKCDNIRFTFEVTEAGEHAGKKTAIWLPIDPNVGGGLNGRKWKNLLVSTARDPSKLEAGPATINAAFFAGKPEYLHVQEVPGKNERGQDNLPNVNPITAELYKKYKAEGYGAATPTKATANGATMQVTGGAPTAAVPQTAAEVTLD